MRLDTRTDEIRRYQHHSNEPRSLSHDSIRILFVDASGSLWIGTDGGGLNRYDPATDSFEHVRQDPGRLQQPQRRSRRVAVSGSRRCDLGGHLRRREYLESARRHICHRGAAQRRTERVEQQLRHELRKDGGRRRLGGHVRRRLESNRSAAPATSLHCVTHRRIPRASATTGCSRWRPKRRTYCGSAPVPAA